MHAGEMLRGREGIYIVVIAPAFHSIAHSSFSLPSSSPIISQPLPTRQTTPRKTPN